MDLKFQVIVDKDTIATSISSQFEASADEPNNPAERFSVASDDPATIEVGDATRAVWEITSAFAGTYLPYVSIPSSAR